jgi:hypothetical protein
VQPKYTGSIQEKYLNKKTTKIKKIMKARNMKTIIGNYPLVKGIEEKGI